VTGTCVFCGAGGKLTREHVLGDWLTEIGLPRDPVMHIAGPLNRSPREVGVSPPFTHTVREVCGACNSGWMSRLEDHAKRVLTPLILGESGVIELEDQGGVAAWAQKTALVAMLVSSSEERAQAYGVLTSEYRALYERRARRDPLPDSQFWVGRYQGTRLASVPVTPMVVTIDGGTSSAWPNAYVMTILVGELLVHGLRFTTPLMAFELVSAADLAPIWPAIDRVEWPGSEIVDDDLFMGLSDGRELSATEPHVSLEPWKPATELPRSVAIGPLIELPTPCGKHVVYYPDLIALDARRGSFYAFVTSCECGKVYLVQSEADGAHFKAEGTEAGITPLYEALSGREFCIEDDDGTFYCKHLDG
jgi:hypothetical protein